MATTSDQCESTSDEVTTKTSLEQVVRPVGLVWFGFNGCGSSLGRSRKRSVHHICTDERLGSCGRVRFPSIGRELCLAFVHVHMQLVSFPDH